MVGGSFSYVGIVGGHDRPAVVDLRAHDQKRTFVKIDDLGRQIVEIEIVFIDPARQ